MHFAANADQGQPAHLWMQSDHSLHIGYSVCKFSTRAHLTDK